jgi:deoxyribonuclease-4
MPLCGAHVDASGGLHRCFERAAAIGAECIQVHPTPPHYWGSPKLDEERIAAFRLAADEYAHPPVFFHAVYLINLASADATLRQRSESTLAGYLRAADELGVTGVIFHTGSHKGAGFEQCAPQIVDHLRSVLERAQPREALLLVENNAGTGGCVGARFEEVAHLVSALDHPRVGVCLDTCHAFASGYDLRTPEAVAATMAEFDRVVGLRHLRAVHCNDSQTGLGSNRDRHENLGDGEIGADGFRALLRLPQLEQTPFVLEVPGGGHGPDEAQIALLKRLAREPVTVSS